MKNPMVYYAVIGIGIIGLVAGGVLLATATKASPHHITSYAALGVGALLVIAGVVGMFVMKPKAAK